MKFTRTEKGMVFSSEENKADQSVLFGVRPCDAHSFALLDKLFDQEKYQGCLLYHQKTKHDGYLDGLCETALCELFLHIG